MQRLKKNFRKYAENSSFISYSLSFIYSKLLGLLAFPKRLSYLGRAHIAWNVRITGWNGCSFGKNSSIGSGSWINVNHRQDGEVSVEIGDNCFVGINNFITAGKKVVMRPYCLTASNCAFVGSSHVIDDPLQPYSTTGTEKKNVIYIGANCFFGYGAVVLGNVNVGRGSVIGSGAIVRSDLPPFTVAVGNPARVVKYYDFSLKEWVKCDGYRLNNDYLPSESEYEAQLKLSCRYPLQPVSAASSWFNNI